MTYRKDYDIALLRLSYPVADPDTGMTILGKGPHFSKNTIMPICLPENKHFKDTNRMAYAVGMGLQGEKDNADRCVTDANGPVPFQRCASKYILQNETEIYNDYNGGFLHTKYLLEGNECVFDSPTPSSLDPLCRKFYGPINELR